MKNKLKCGSKITLKFPIIDEITGELRFRTAAEIPCEPINTQRKLKTQYILTSYDDKTGKVIYNAQTPTKGNKK